MEIYDDIWGENVRHMRLVVHDLFLRFQHIICLSGYKDADELQLPLTNIKGKGVICQQG